MGRVPKQTAGTGFGAKISKPSGEKVRSATTESHGASRVEPSKVTQKKRDTRAKKGR